MTSVLPSDWRKVDLVAWAAEHGAAQLVPVLGKRSDGVPLLYPGKAHLLFGEPGLGKSFLGIEWAASAGPGSLYLDFERDSTVMAARLVALGHDLSEIDYRQTRSRLTDVDHRLFYEELRAHTPPVMILDSWSEALACFGFKRDDAEDVSKFYRFIVRPALGLGVCVVLIDHPVKDKQARNRYPVGSERKLALVDAAFSLDAERGQVRVTCTKDNHGGITTRPQAHVADLRIADHGEGWVAVALDPPGSQREAAAQDRRSADSEEIAACILALFDGENREMTAGEIKSKVGKNVMRTNEVRDRLVREGLLSERDQGVGKAKLYTRSARSGMTLGLGGTTPELPPVSPILTSSDSVFGMGATTHSPVPHPLVGEGVDGMSRGGHDEGGRNGSPGTGPWLEQEEAEITATELDPWAALTHWDPADENPP